jgi:predicted small secreted protein
MRRLPLALSLALSASFVLTACAGLRGMGRDTGMSFFVTSANPGRGADFGGLAGADRHCEALATAAGAGGKNWRAYLSTTGAGGVNARDRIGRGPWRNARGVEIAAGIDQLHGTNQLTKQTALTEKGEMVMGRGDATNLHDILTGSTPDGRATAGGTQDTTCGNWTKSGEGSAIVGHHDRVGLRDDEPSRSWNSSHGTRGCGMDALKSTGGGGLLYCFAAR